MNAFLLSLAVVIAGFAFGSAEAPDGDEWQSPERLSLNKEYPHAWFFSFQDRDAARKVLPEYSSFWKSLDGQWRFHWSEDPDRRPSGFFAEDFDDSHWDYIDVPSNWNVAGICKDGSQKYGTPIYVNVNVPFYHKNEPGDWAFGVMRTPPENWTMFSCRNEVGSYRRSFTVPSLWKGYDVYINFGGVDSFFYLWINGRYVGFSKNSRNIASFNITRYLKEGDNVVSVEVYRNSDASNLEAQDMFRLPGIFRTVSLEAKPSMRVRDIRVTPSMTSLDIKCLVEGGVGRIDWRLYENSLYSDRNVQVAEFLDRESDCTLEYPLAKPWSAEEPNLYVLVGELKDKKGRVVDIFSLNVGFRQVEIRDVDSSQDEFAKAGRYFFLNGKSFKMRGVNRHETSPQVGHAVTRSMMEEDIFLMKKANINHVRNSHYPDDPYWYYLCDRYGIYLMDEANNESHHYGYKEASLTHVPQYRNAFVARMEEMIVQNYNHPSILVWSSGNECGPGVNFKYVYDAAKALDSIRPVQYERNNDYSDFGCRQYPTVGWVAKCAEGDSSLKYPYHINEFAHSMGNALGDFVHYWRCIDGSNMITGACIWDWVDQSLYNYTKDGIRYLACGGDFGDTPNDGQFVMNGILFGDREPKPQYYEVKKVYQNLYASLENGALVLFNRNYYTSCSYDCHWTLLQDGNVALEGDFDTGDISPRGRTSMRFSADFLPCCLDLPRGKECFLNLSFRQKEDLPWAERGYEVCSEQILLQSETSALVNVPALPAVRCSKERNGFVHLSGRNFDVTFDMAKGTLHSLRYRGRDCIVPGNGPELNLFRACVNNDGWGYRKWIENSLYSLEHKVVNSAVTKDGEGGFSLSFDVVSQAPCATTIKGHLASNRIYLEDAGDSVEVASFTSHLVWRIAGDGKVSLTSHIDCSDGDFTPARVGYIMKVPSTYSNLAYYGRGPLENYRDRKSSQFVGVYSSKVTEQFTLYTKPQEHSNHEDVRWMQLCSDDGDGIKVTPGVNSWNTSSENVDIFGFSATQYSAIDLLKSAHIYELPAKGDTFLCIDAAQAGLGGNSCGPRPLDEDIIHTGGDFGFTISPVF